MLYLGKAFDSLTNKFQSFQKIKNIQRFRVFILSYRANAKEWKQRKIYKTSFQWQINQWVLSFWF